MSDKPPAKKPNASYRKCCIYGSLALICFIPAATIFCLSTMKFMNWYQETHDLNRTNDLIIHTTLLIATCAPLCVFFGMGMSRVYYLRKRNKYGKFESTMRRQGRGYWIDPSDAEDKKKLDLAKKLNAEPRAKPMERSTAPAPATTTRSGFNPFVWGAGDRYRSKNETLTTETSTAKRLTNLNPFGWGSNNEHRPRTAHVPANNNEIELGNVPRKPVRTLNRSDSTRSCRGDPAVEKGFANIWLSAVRGSAKGHDGRKMRKANWDEEMEKME